ncbi:MAG: hypothetical protein Q4G08_09250 [Capnocytophaga sp.]|nr:hypothetical protein [Capnocytophaga sp.]
MISKFKKLKEIVAEHCITIALNTHRTKPDYEKDPLSLKNLIKEAKEKLESVADKRTVETLMNKVDALAQNIDHSHNQEALMLFVSDTVSEYVRLPIAVTDRVTVDVTFVTRDIIRALHLETNYYILLLSRQKARLFEAVNDKIAEEIAQPFPIDGDQFYALSRPEHSNASRVRSIISEFFNRVDKAVNEVRKNHSLPVFICTEESNYYEYMKIADQKESIFPVFLTGNHLEANPNVTAIEAWKILKEEIIIRNNQRKEELMQAIGNNKFLSDTTEIWNAIQQGRVQTLFVEKNLHRSAIVEDNHVQYIDYETHNPEAIADIYDEMIEMNASYGGDTVFLPDGELKKFNGFGAVTRY